MMLRVDGLEQRPKGSGVWKYRRAIPPHLRDAFDGKWQIIRSLKTKDKLAALRKLPGVAAEVERQFREAEKAIGNPQIAAYKAVEEWRQYQASRPYHRFHEEAVDHHITSLRERDDLSEHQRTVLLAC